MVLLPLCHVCKAAAGDVGVIAARARDDGTAARIPLQHARRALPAASGGCNLRGSHSQDGFSIHPRYVLPALPFLYIWISKLGLAFRYRHRFIAAIVVASLSWSIASSLFIYPTASPTSTNS